LGALAETCQSYEIVALACWHHCALAETLEGKKRELVVSRAKELAEKLPSYAPLADRESRSLFARARLDVAQLAGDHEEIERWATEVRSPFYHQVLSNLRKNPTGSRIRLPFRREIQKHLTCLPASLASALAAMEVNVDADSMASEVTYGGTSDWAAAEWLESRGFSVRSFVVTPEIACRLLRNGIAFVLSLEADDFAHAVAIVGLDEAAGTLLVHDPQQFRTTEYLLEAFGHEAPLGPKGMAAVPPQKLSLLDELLPADDVEVMTASMSYQRALQLQGPSVAGVFVAELEKRHPSHPVTHLLQAIQDAEDGRTGEALARFQKLLEICSEYLPLRARLLHACRSLGNTALLRDALENVVERGLLPGVESQQAWLYPPSGYVWQYADLLRLSAATKDRSRTMLHSLIRRESSCGEAWHVLADLLWHERDFEGALLSYRLGSCLAEANEHYASAYAEALGICGRVEEGLSWLSNRVRTFGASSRATSTWITWISALETWGRPEGALAASNEALQIHGSAPDLLGFLVSFFARMGLWDRAEELLNRLESSGNFALLHEAAVDFHSMRGETDEALRHADAWVREAPVSLRAKSLLLDEIGARDGAEKALALVKRWLSEQPGHDGLEELCCAHLDRASEPLWRKARLLRRRLKRNSEDGWAWRELAGSYLQQYSYADAKRRKRLAPRIAELIAQCHRTAPDDPSTLRAKASWSEERGEWAKAVDLWIESIDRDPGTPYGYRRAWECAARFDKEERLEVWRRLEATLLSFPGRLQAAREALFLAAQRFGIAFAEEAASRWREARPNDPEVIEASSDLLLDYGHGRSDAERALSLLKPAVEQFPFHLALRFSLLHAYRKLGRFEDAEEAVREIIRRHPGSSAGKIQLAWVHELAGRSEEALSVLDAAIPKDPQNGELANALVQILLRTGRLAEAREVGDKALDRLPRSVYWRERAVQFFLDCGDEENAVRVAREGVSLFPRGAYLWYLLGETLDRIPRFAAQGEVEKCLRRSLELNRSLFDTVDRLAIVLVGQRRYEETEELLREVEARLSDPCPARGRLAWVHRVQGQKEAAVEEMVSALKAAPWYQWGWSVLMAWLMEDQAWDRAKSLLGTIPPEIRTYPQHLKERLRLLEKAGLGEKELDAEWTQLLSDFSEDVPMHLERYDSLRDRKRVPDAAAVLRNIQPVNPDDPFMNARMVEVLAREHKREEAIEALHRVFFAPVERSEWPADFAWETLKNAGFADEAFQSVNAALEKGSRPTLYALTLWASYALEQGNPERRRPQPLWRTWLPDSGARKVLEILRRKDRFPWVDGRYRAGLFIALSDLGYSALVARYWRKHRAEVEADLDCWAQTARALLELGRKREARKLLSGWRDRPGVLMWNVANYVECFTGVFPKHLMEIRTACAQALAGLPHDHCSRYLAHVLAEACALLDDPEGFLVAWNEYRAYFDGQVAEGEWFKGTRRHLLEDVPQMAQLLERNERWKFRRTVWRLRFSHLTRRVRDSQVIRGMSRVPFVVWWLIFLATVAVLANL
jgi:tetratricopeptide (TPR) repeat protein